MIMRDNESEQRYRDYTIALDLAMQIVVMEEMINSETYGHMLTQSLKRKVAALREQLHREHADIVLHFINQIEKEIL